MTTFNRSLRRRGLAVTLPVMLVMNTPALRAQSTKKFEVASVRRVEIPPTVYGVPVFPTSGGVGTSSPGRITYRGTWLKPLIAEAFGVRSDQITGPTWLNTERYDIVANIPQGATKDDLTGRYDFMIRYQFQGRGGDAGAAADRAPTVFTAVEEQLGLKLDPTTKSFPALIIDSIEREPTEN